MKHFKPITPILLAGLFSLSIASCNKENAPAELNTPNTQRIVSTATVAYLLDGNKVNTHTTLIRQKIAELGATETAFIPQLKMMAVRSAAPNFQTALESLGVNVHLDLKLSCPQVQSVPNNAPSLTAPATTNPNPLFPLQWNLQAISAPAAWALGYKGQGVRVAVLDVGFYMHHPDLEANINQTLGRNFVGLPGENLLDPSFTGTGLSHATHVTGIIAAIDNNIGVVGVAPKVEILPIKVLPDEPNPLTQISWVAQGIVYAADHGAKVINMSLGGLVLQGSGQNATGIAYIKSLYNQAIQYAYNQGVTVICAAGNDALDFDHTGSYEVLPSNSPHALCIAATGPDTWYDKFLNNLPYNLDIPAFYTNYGISRIDFAAPGGNFNFNSTSPNRFYDLVTSTATATGYDQELGTSMAAPHVAAVAALIIGKNGGSMSPTAVKTKLRQSADDLGNSGKDKYFGYGRVNALKAVQ
jgi:lantibiotic leader peptide-processing serine protease